MPQEELAAISFKFTVFSISLGRLNEALVIFQSQLVLSVTHHLTSTLIMAI
jgi:hypothetical protein